MIILLLLIGLNYRKETKVKMLFVGKVAEMLEVTTQTVRSFESRGILIPIRDWSGYRRYKAEDVENLKRDLLAGKFNQRGSSKNEALS